MRKLFYILPLIALLFMSCSASNTLDGTFQDNSNDGKKVYLLTMKSLKENFEASDSTVVENGKFHFKLKKTDEPSVAYLVIQGALPGTPNGIPFVYENGNIQITIDSIARITGTPLNDKGQQFFENLSQIAKKMDAVDGEIVQTADDSTKQQYIQQMDALNKEMSNVGYEFIKENIKNKIGEFYFISFMTMLSDDQIKELRSLSNPEHQKLIDEIMVMKNVSTQSQGANFVGQKYIDITGDNPEGKKIALSDYVGKNKLVLVDFWASWCGPCIKEMPNLVKAYAEYKSKGFEIVGISLDEKKNEWTSALKKLNMTWPQMSDLKGWNSDLSAPYHVQGIPFTLLIDQDGNIIGENLRGNQLDEKLKELLK